MTQASWGAAPFQKPSNDELKKRLKPTQYDVTQRDGTEPPFKNEYWDHKEAGIYVDVVSGEPLFSSLDKYDSGTGWPSFWRPIDPEVITTRQDRKLWSVRTEVRSKQADSHLGHVFDDGPQPTGLRYCMNSAALRFVPVARLEAEGYGKYAARFATKATAPGKPEIAILAGGCFWGMEEILRTVPGVLSTRVGYTGGTSERPKYEEVKSGRTGHAESVEITFDPSRLSYEDLLTRWFFKMHDPTTLNQQGNDRGTQYRSAIFVASPEQKAAAERAKAAAQKSGRWKLPIVTAIVPASTFWPAEEYHQNYLVKNPGGYTCHFMRE